MAVAHVQDTPIKVIANTPGSITFPANTTVGNVVCVFVDVSVDETAGPRPTPSGGGVATWTLAPMNTSGTSNNTYIFYGAVTSSGSNAIAFTDPSSVYWSAGASEFSGVDATTRIANVSYNTNSLTTINVGPLTPTAVGQLIFVGNGTTNGENRSPYTAGSPWTMGTALTFSGSVGDYGNTDWLISTSTSAVTATYSYTAANNPQGVAGIILAATGSGITGTGTMALGPVSLSASGTVGLPGTGTMALGPVTMATTGTPRTPGTSTVALGPISLAASGAPVEDGTGTWSLGPISLSSTSIVYVAGSVTVAVGPVTLAATGGVGGAGDGTGTFALGPITTTVVGTESPLYFFTPPADAQTIGPIPAWERDDPRDPGARLMRYFPPTARGVNVFKMADGTYVRDDVEGVWPTTPDMPNNALSSTWGVGALSPIITPIDNPVMIVYYAAHIYWIDQTEAAALTAAGYGEYITTE